MDVMNWCGMKIAYNPFHSSSMNISSAMLELRYLINGKLDVMSSEANIL